MFNKKLLQFEIKIYCAKQNHSYLRRVFLSRINIMLGGLNSKSHAASIDLNKPLTFLLRDGQDRDYRGPARVLPSLPVAKVLIGDKGYYSA